MIGGVFHGLFELNHSDLAVRNISARMLSLYLLLDVEKPDGGLFETQKRSIAHILRSPRARTFFVLSALDRQDFGLSLACLTSTLFR